MCRVLALLPLLLPLPATAGVIEEAVQAQLSGAAVYVAAGAPLKVDAARLTERINHGTTPVFIAVLPDTPHDAGELPLIIGRQLPVPMAVGVLAGRSFRANAVGMVGTQPAITIAAAATSAFNTHRSGGPTAVLLNWVERISPPLPVTASADPAPLAEDRTPPPAAGGSWWWSFFWVALVGLGGGLVWHFVRRERRIVEQLRQADAARAHRLHAATPPPIRPTPSAWPASPATVKLDKEYRYSRTATPGCPHYYGGGYYNGVHVQPGYYSDPFWNYLVLSTILSQHAGAPATPAAPLAATSEPASRLSGERRRSESGGGDFSASSSSGSRSSGGGDFGGGSSGGGDFGGSSSGGGDFGGGSSGGGDF